MEIGARCKVVVLFSLYLIIREELVRYVSPLDGRTFPCKAAANTTFWCLARFCEGVSSVGNVRLIVELLVMWPLLVAVWQVADIVAAGIALGFGH